MPFTFGRPLNTSPVDPALLEQANRALFARAQIDSAPVGSVGALGGVRPSPKAVDRRVNPFQMAALASAPIPGVGDAMGLAADMNMYSTDPESRTMGNFGLSALGLLPFVPAMTAWHGSPHIFDVFDTAKIGTGEGAQAYGRGLYFAENEGIARHYKEALAGDAVPEVRRLNDDIFETEETLKSLRRGERPAWWSQDAEVTPDVVSQWEDSLLKISQRRDDLQKTTGGLYKVDIADDQIPRMLDWDAQIADQPEHIRQALAPLIGDSKTALYSNGSTLVRNLEDRMGKAKAAEFLQELGIPGIKFLDSGSRGTGTGTRNYVVFNAADVKVLSRNGEGIAGIGASADDAASRVRGYADDVVTGYRGTGGGAGASEGHGVYVTKSPDIAAQFGDVSEVRYRQPRRPLIVGEDDPLAILTESDILDEPIKATDSEWLRLQKQAAQNANARDVGNDWAGAASEELSKLLRDSGYDAVRVTSGGESWDVLMDDALQFTTENLPDGRVNIIGPDGRSTGLFATDEVDEAISNMAEGYSKARRQRTGSPF